MKILGVDSTATAASAAVYCDGKILSLNYSNTGLTHSQTLMPMIDNVLKTAGVNIRDIDYFAVSNGPGSFTGVRIGVSAVKGMAQPIMKKCVPVSTLEVIAKPLENTSVYAIAVMDARCNQVYIATFDCNNGMERLCDDRAISIDELANDISSLNGIKMLIGDGAQLCYGKLKDRVEGITIAPANIRFQNASSVAIIAADKLVENESSAIDAAELLPDYLRLSQAERELKSKK